MFTKRHLFYRIEVYILYIKMEASYFVNIMKSYVPPSITVVKKSEINVHLWWRSNNLYGNHKAVDDNHQ